MNQRLPLALSVTIQLALLGASAGAQVEFAGEPTPAGDLRSAAPTVDAPPVDVAAMLEEDEARGKRGLFRFGAELPMAHGLEDSGVWEIRADGKHVWRLRLRSEGALSISLMFSRYHLPPGAQLFVYNDDRSSVRGAYTAANNKPDGLFAIQPVAGDAVTVEYVTPDDARGQGSVAMCTLVHDYKGVLDIFAGWQTSACEIDVACPQGAPWQNQIRATLQVQVGGGLCSGSLLNNTRNDGDQLFMTADHCGNLNNAIFRFKYQRSGCGTGSAPSNLTVQGSRLLANNANIDFRLARITQPIPASYDPYYAGWDRSGTPPPNSVTVHHPQGGTKKISFDNDPPTYSGTDWKIATWELGVTEPGSSGCPLYDNTGRFIGQLWGGAAACGYPYNDYYGRLDAEWSRVRSFLDPIGSGVQKIDGYDPLGPVTPVVRVVEPASVTAFSPGTVYLVGNGFNGATDVSVGGQSVPFSVVRDTLITFAAPAPIALGAASVTVTNTVGTSGPGSLNYIATDPPNHSVPSAVVSGNTLPISFGGPPNHSYVFGMSLDTSTIQFNGYSLLANLVQVQAGALSAVGLAPGINPLVPTSAAGFTLHNQVWTIDFAAGLGTLKASAPTATTVQ